MGFSSDNYVQNDVKKTDNKKEFVESFRKEADEFDAEMKQKNGQKKISKAPSKRQNNLRKKLGLNRKPKKTTESRPVQVIKSEQNNDNGNDNVDFINFLESSSPQKIQTSELEKTHEINNNDMVNLLIMDKPSSNGFQYNNDNNDDLIDFGDISYAQPSSANKNQQGMGNIDLLNNFGDSPNKNNQNSVNPNTNNFFSDINSDLFDLSGMNNKKTNQVKPINNGSSNLGYGYSAGSQHNSHSYNGNVAQSSQIQKKGDLKINEFDFI